MNHKADHNTYGNLNLGFAPIGYCFEPRSFRKEHLQILMKLREQLRKYNAYYEVIKQVQRRYVSQEGGM